MHRTLLKKLGVVAFLLLTCNQAGGADRPLVAETNADRLLIRGNDALRTYVLSRKAEVERLINAEAQAYVDQSTVACLGVLAEDAGDVSFPESGVFGTCLARADMGWPDSDDTIVQISVTGEFEISVKVLATQY